MNHWVKSSYTWDRFSPLGSLLQPSLRSRLQGRPSRWKPIPRATTFHSVVHSFHSIFSTSVRKWDIAIIDLLSNLFFASSFKTKIDSSWLVWVIKVSLGPTFTHVLFTAILDGWLLDGAKKRSRQNLLRIRCSIHKTLTLKENWHDACHRSKINLKCVLSKTKVSKEMFFSFWIGPLAAIY